MTDPVIEALRAYESEAAAAHEVLRRARARLAERLRGLLAEELGDSTSAAFLHRADPTEPNGAEFATDQAGVTMAIPLDSQLATLGGLAPTDHAEVAQEAEPVVTAPAEARASADQAGGGGSTPPLRSTPVFRCPECPHETVSQNGLRIHVGRVHHRRLTDDEVAVAAPLHLTNGARIAPSLDTSNDESDRPLATTPFFCFRCGQPFPSGEALAEHRRSDGHRLRATS